jgi:hypothetical protein
LKEESASILLTLSRKYVADTTALEFIALYCSILETWDDIIDGDCPSRDAINSAFFSALISLPRNRFYAQHFARLSPLIEAGIYDWHTANALEASRAEGKLRFSYVLRSSVLAAVTAVIAICAGPAMAISANTEIRSRSEAWADYLKEHGAPT